MTSLNKFSSHAGVYRHTLLGNFVYMINIVDVFNIYILYDVGGQSIPSICSHAGLKDTDSIPLLQFGVGGV